MKTIFLFLLLFCFKHAQSQDSLKIYYDKDWKKTYDNHKAEFYRMIPLDAMHKPFGTVKSYYKNGKLRSESVRSHIDTSDFKNDTLEGPYRLFSKDGKLIRETYFINGKKEGGEKVWYDSGELWSVTHYKNDRKHGEESVYNKDGNYILHCFYDVGALENKKGTYYDRYLYQFDYFSDYFQLKENIYDWTYPDSSESECYIKKDTGLFIRNKSSHETFAHVEVPWTLKFLVSVAAVLEKDSGDNDAGYGLVYNFIDRNNYSYFLIRQDGYFCHGQVSNGKQSAYQWKRTRKLNPNNQANRLGVGRHDDKLEFYINQSRVEAIPYVPFTNGIIGVMCDEKDQSVLLKGIEMYQH